MANKKQTKKTSATNGAGKPAYKQWWFWVIIVVVAGFIIGLVNMGNSNNPKKVDGGDNSSSMSNSDSQKNEFKVGDTIAIEDYEVTVLDVVRNFDSGNPYITPKDGKEFVKVNIQVVNKSDETKSYNVLEWKIQDSDGAIESPDGLSYTVDDGLNSGELASGGKKNGSIVFEAPAGDAGLKLHYKPIWSFSNEAIIIL